MADRDNGAPRVRPATPGDAPVIWSMLRALAEHDGALDHFRATVDDIRREGFGNAPAFEVLIAERDGDPAGLLKFYEIYSCYQGRRCMFVDALYIDAARRRAGVGKALMAHAAEIARQRHYGRIDLTVKPGNARAKAFYRSLGMAPVDEELYRLDADHFDQDPSPA